MTLYEMRQMDKAEAREEGRDEGRKEGLQEGLARSVRLCYFQLHYSPSRIAEALEISEAQVKEILDGLEQKKPET